MAVAKPMGWSAMSSIFTPPSFLPAGGLIGWGLLAKLEDIGLKPDVGTLLGMPFKGAEIFAIR